MVWWGVSYSSATQIHFCNTGVKNKWWVLPSYIKQCLITSGGNCICGQTWVVLSAGFCAPLQSKKKMQNGCTSRSQISSKWMTSPLPAQTSIHWTINCGRCWRNVNVPGGTKISTHWRLRSVLPDFFFQHRVWICTDFFRVYRFRTDFFPGFILGLYFQCSCCQKYQLYWQIFQTKIV